jgi:hypothetical protein
MSDTPVSLIPAPGGYAEWLTDLKSRIHTAQQRAALAVNRELVLLYWQIGRDILARQAEQGWGAKVIERLAHDLREAFPEMKGFSPRNLKYMRAFAEAWPDAVCASGACTYCKAGKERSRVDRITRATSAQAQFRPQRIHPCLDRRVHLLRFRRTRVPANSSLYINLR